VYDGLPLAGVRIRLAPDGRVQLAGPTLFAGYLGRPDLTAQVLHAGWLHTHDLGVFERDGRLAVLGRVDDVIISGGTNVALPRVAARVREHPAVADAVCIGVPDPEWGTAVVAFTVGHDGRRVERDDIREWVGQALGRHCVPRRVLPVSSLPMLANGKPDLTALRAWAEAAGNDAGAADLRRSRT
jgi:O-succinylbenzoic acid--CoA ligase